MELQETLEDMGMNKSLSALFNNDNSLEICWFGYGQLMELLLLVAGNGMHKLF